MDGERTFLACGSLRLATTGLFWKGREGRDCGSAWFRWFQWWVHPQFASFGCFVGQINIVRRGRGTTREPRVLPIRIIRAIRGCAVESAVPSGVLELMRWGQRTLQHLYSKTRVPHALGTKAISADDLHVQSFAGMA